MTFFWSTWITVLSIGCWAFILGVLLYVLKYKPEVEEDGTTGHNYDGITEYDKPLPKWWLVIFFGSIIWGVGYWILFPAIWPKSWTGIATVEVDGETVPWTSHNELNSDLESNNNVFIASFEKDILEKAGATGAMTSLTKLDELQTTLRRSEKPPADLQKNIDEQIAALDPYVQKLSQSPDALKVGGRLFLQNCAVCHGSNAKGATGYPNLTDNDWLYGGEPVNILTTLHNGRVGGMPAWRDQIGEDGVRATAEYVLSLSSKHGDVPGKTPNGDLDKTLVAQGAAIYKQNCVVCHGENGKGMTSVGAPNLTDNVWLYGGEREVVRDTLRHGRAGVMPEWETKLGNERIMLLASYIYSLSNNNVNATAPKAVQEPRDAQPAEMKSEQATVDTDKS